MVCKDAGASQRQEPDHDVRAGRGVLIEIVVCEQPLSRVRREGGYVCDAPELPLRKSNPAAPPATNHPDGQLSKTRQSAIEKIFRLAFDPTQLFNMRVSPDTRGGSRSSRTRVEMRWTPNARLTSAREADGEVVWS